VKILSKSISWGAISVINAMPGGIGAVIGTELTTSSEFILGGDSRIVDIISDRSEPTLLAELCVSASYALAGVDEPEGWHLTTSSEMPPSKGLKSSSSACNAIISAVFKEIGFITDPLTTIKLGVECARQAKVTRTGSFDDACGCYYGGYIMTDNTKDSIIFIRDVPKYDVVIHIPEQKIRKESLDIEPLKRAAVEQRKAIELSKTDFLSAMTLNGRIIAKASGIDNSVAEMAMKAGALAAGISGSGPSTAILLEYNGTEKFLKQTGLENVIVTKTRKLTK
jgi:shikimate kinase